MAETTATVIEREGIFKQNTIVIRGARGGERSETISKKYKTTKTHDYRIMIEYTATGGKSIGLTSRGTISARSYSKRKAITVDRLFVVQETKTGLSEPKEITP